MASSWTRLRHQGQRKSNSKTSEKALTSAFFPKQQDVQEGESLVFWVCSWSSWWWKTSISPDITNLKSQKGIQAAGCIGHSSEQEERWSLFPQEAYTDATEGNDMLSSLQNRGEDNLTLPGATVQRAEVSGTAFLQRALQHMQREDGQSREQAHSNSKNVKQTKQVKLKSHLLPCSYCTASAVNADMASHSSPGKEILSPVEKNPQSAAPKSQPKPSIGTVGKRRLLLKNIMSITCHTAVQFCCLRFLFVLINFCFGYLMDRCLFNLPFPTIYTFVIVVIITTTTRKNRD